MPLLPIWTDESLYVAEYSAPELARFEFRRVRAASDGTVKAEILVSSTMPGFEEKLSRSDLNLLADQTVKRFAQTIKERSNGQGHLDWHGMLANAIEHVIDRFRAGEPAIYLRDAPEPETDEFLLSPLVLGRQPTILYGHGGDTKSLTALAAGLSIHADREILPGLHPSSRKRVGLLDWEYDPWEHKKRAHQLLGPSLPDLVYLRCSGALRDQVDRVKATVRQYDLGFLILDSILPAVGGDPNAPDVALAFFDAMRAIGLGILCVAHVTKQGDEDMPFGSVMFHNLARATWFVKKVQSPGENTARVGFFNKKGNGGRLHHPFGLLWKWEGDGVQERTSVERIDVRETPGLSSKVSIGDRVMNALNSGKLTMRDLMDEMQAADPDVSQETIRKTVQRLEKSGRVCTVGVSAQGAPEYGRATDELPF